MNTWADERRAVEERFQSNWGTTSLVKYENVSFTPDAKKPYVSLLIQPTRSKQISINPDPVIREPGTIVVEVFVPKDGGTQTARTLADKAADIFRRQQFSVGDSGRFTCFTPSLKVIGVDGGWYQVNVLIPYWRNVTYI